MKTRSFIANAADRFKRTFAFVLMLTLLFTVQPFSVTAAEEMPTETPVQNEAQKYLYGDQLATHKGLTEQERVLAIDIYELMKSATPSGEELTKQLTMPIPYKADAGSQINASITKSSQAAYDAFSRDYPEKFWYASGAIGMSTSFDVATAQIVYGTVTLKNYIRKEFASDTKTFADRFQENVDSFEVKGETTAEKLRSIHDTLCEKNNYVIGAAYAHNAYGGLVDGQSVCEGYAKGFKVICDRENIPCVLVSGMAYSSVELTDPEAHMWNLVQLEDGQWYAVDVTWDDQEIGILTDFFLAGANTVPVHFAKLPFAKSHAASTNFGSNNFEYQEFTYPELSGEAHLSVQPTPEPTVEPTAEPTVEPTTEPSAAPEILYGDVDDDGKVTASDALLVLKIVVRIETNVEQEMLIRADVDGTTVVNAEDALTILKQVVKIIDKFPVEQNAQ